MYKKVAGRYKILGLIGTGGMGAVYKAEDELLDRIVAIKTIVSEAPAAPKQQNDEVSELKSLYFNEARMMAKAQHPNIVPIYDLIEEDKNFYIIMPILPNKWRAWKELAKEKSLGEIIRFFDRIADGLDYLHSHNIIHRDLKPANILIGDDEQPYISDFGLSRRTEINKSGDFSGTIAYMPPEGFEEAAEESPARDIYSLGIMVYEAITGEHPYAGKGMTALIQAVLDESVPSIREKRPELAFATIRDIDAVIAKLTAKKPENRYKTALEAVNELQRIVASSLGIVEGKLFISYARNDQDFVYLLVDELQNYGVNLWVDRHIEYGSAWDESIDDQLANCDVK